MIMLIIFSVILGAIVSGITGIGFLFWVVAVIVFICGLPGLVIDVFAGGIISDIQDREDYREFMRQIDEDDRMDRYLDKLDELEDRREKHQHDTYIDNRQIHLHKHYDDYEDDLDDLLDDLDDDY